jgi:hypothetical protein
MYDNVRVTGLVLRKQHLVPLTFGSRQSDVSHIVDDVCGLQWDDVERENPDWALRNRFTDYRVDWLESSIRDRTVIEFRLMRGCLYLVPSPELPYYYAATREVVKKTQHGNLKSKLSNQIGENEQKVLGALRRHAPATQSELIRRSKVAKSEFWGALLNLDNLGYVFRVGWKGNQNLWHSAEEWLPEVDLRKVTREEGEEYLTVKFFKAAGPSTRQCLSQWTGWSIETTNMNVDRLVNKGKLVKLNPTRPESLIALPRDIDELGSYTGRDSTVRFLSSFDPYLCMRGHLLWLGDFSPTSGGIYSVSIGGIVAAAFRVVRSKKLLLIADFEVFQKSLLSSRSAEVRREIEMQATSTNRRAKLSPKVRALL